MRFFKTMLCLLFVGGVAAGCTSDSSDDSGSDDASRADTSVPNENCEPRDIPVQDLHYLQTPEQDIHLAAINPYYYRATLDGDTVTITLMQGELPVFYDPYATERHALSASLDDVERLGLLPVAETFSPPDYSGNRLIVNRQLLELGIEHDLESMTDITVQGPNSDGVFEVLVQRTTEIDVCDGDDSSS